MFLNQHNLTQMLPAIGLPFRGLISFRWIASRWKNHVAFLLWIALASISGCNTLSLPAIDPTGNRIFSNNPLIFVNPHDPNNGYPSQQPSFQAPPPPPACLQGKDGAPKKLCQGCLSGKGCFAKRKEAEEVRGRCGQLLLTPTSIVAPVGGEVILLAGICGKDGYLVINEPVEWMMSPKSVGEFVEVGDDSKGQPRSFWKKEEGPKVEKLAVDFARGRTSREAGNITRGTSDPADDLPIRKGQTWISITSPNEGISKVTALAPDSDVWDQRRQTATIYWEDAAWEFPTPQIEKSGQRVRLVTHVWRSDRTIGAEGWLVKYRILNPEIAGFLPSGAETAEVFVDSQGVAAIEIEIGSRSSAARIPGMIPRGTAAIQIEIVRPKRAIENIPELSMAVGNTTVTWIAPQLKLDVGGPAEAVPGQLLTYFATAANVGDVDAENTEVSVQIPPGMQLQSTSVKPSVETADVLRWELGPLRPRSAFDVSVNLIAKAPMGAVINFSARSLDLSDVKGVPTQILQPQASLRVVPSPESMQIEVGGVAVFDVTATNAGNQTINDLAITLTSDPGLQHVKDNLNSVVSVIGLLNPGQSTTVTGRFRVEREGDLSVRATAQALGQILASSQPATIRSLPARPKTPSIKMQVTSDLRNPAVIPLGGQFKAVWTIFNTGPVVLRNPVVLMKHSTNLEVKGLSPGGSYEAVRQFGQWRLQDLQPGGSVGLEGLFQGIAAGNQASVQFSVESDGVSDQQSIILDISNSGAGSDVMPPGNNNAPGGVPPGSGVLQKPSLTLDRPDQKRLGVTIQPVSNAIRTGDTVTYEIRIENLINKPDQRVSLSILTPQGAILKSIRAKELRYKLTNNDRQIDLEPIQYFRPNDSFSCVIQLKHDQVAAGELIASVTSLGQTTPVTTSLSIQVLER